MDLRRAAGYKDLRGRTGEIAGAGLIEWWFVRNDQISTRSSLAYRTISQIIPQNYFFERKLFSSRKNRVKKIE